MKWIKTPLVALTLASTMASAWASQEYQQSIASDSAAQKVPSVIQVVKPNQTNKKQTVAQAADTQIAVLMSKLMELNKEVNVNQQNAMQRIDTIKDGETQLSDTVQKLQGVIRSLDQQVAELKSQSQHMMVAANNGNWVTNLKQQWGPTGFYGGMVAAAILLMMLAYMVWPKSAGNRSKPARAGNAENQSEYDFMATSEAIPAKLDLARAYMAMEDYESAKGVCAEVFAKGDDQQKQQAQNILTDIKQKGAHAD